jgi:glycosyltransferase involved in cell wall biosynthesis
MPEFSICIPTYEYKGRGVEFLSHLFDTLEEQTFTDYEVIVSDHSQDLEIYNFCEKSGDRFDLKYLRNSEQRGSLSQNTNMCFRIAQGRILKPVEWKVYELLYIDYKTEEQVCKILKFK